MYKSNEIIVSDVFKELGISPALKGYHYARYAVCAVLENKSPDTFTKLYHHIATEFDSSYSKVERCIRTAIDKMMLCGNHEAIIKIFGSCASIHNGRLTNTEFIHGVADYIRTYILV